jgi:hypothetical protein
MPEKKQTSNKDTVVHSISFGATTADIHLHFSNAGYEYYSLKLHRVFTASSGKQVRSSEFFGKNAQEIAQAAHEASEWINAHQQADAQTILRGNVE